MESKNTSIGIKKMSNIGNPDFLNYVNSGLVHKDGLKEQITAIHIRLNRKMHYRVKKAVQVTNYTQQVIGLNAIINYLNYIEKELGIDLSEGYEEYKEANE